MKLDWKYIIDSILHTFYFKLAQYQFGRKLMKGTWYYIFVSGISVGSFWTNIEITSCQAVTLKTETY